jgi:hypothetical protein
VRYLAGGATLRELTQDNGRGGGAIGGRGGGVMRDLEGGGGAREREKEGERERREKLAAPRCPSTVHLLHTMYSTPVCHLKLILADL